MIRGESGCVFRYQRTFMRPLLPGSRQTGRSHSGHGPAWTMYLITIGCLPGPAEVCGGAPSCPSSRSMSSALRRSITCRLLEWNTAWN